MRKEASLTIGDVDFVVKQMDPFQAIKTQLDLAALLGASAGSLDISALMQDKSAIVGVLGQLDADKTMCLVKRLLQGNALVHTSAGVAVDINRDFEGNIMGVYELLWFVLQVNYRDFFLDARKKVKVLLEALAAKS
jgi:hypothetical protein